MTVPVNWGQTNYAFAKDNVGNVSEGVPFTLDKVDKLPPSIASIGYNGDNSTIMIRGSDNESSVVCIYIDGAPYPGSTVSWDIPVGTRYIKLQAEDMNGDRSAVLIRRVPGWSEVVTTLAVTDVTFTDYNTTAQITAAATGGDSVSGIIVNGKAYEGNPIIYTVPKGTETLAIQVYNPRGDRSPMVNKQVPMDSSKSTLKLSVEHPEWTKSRSARVKLVAEDKNRITKILVRTGEDSEWAEVTEKRYIDITADTTVYAMVENDKGESKEVSQDIECFDRTAPTVTATQDGKTVNIRATDNKSGVTAIPVNNKEYQRGDFEEGKLAYRIPEGTTMVIVKAEDAAGNLSRAVELPIQNTVAALPVIISPTPAPTPKSELLPEEAAIPEPLPTPEPEPAAPKTEPEQPAVEAAAQPEIF